MVTVVMEKQGTENRPAEAIPEKRRITKRFHYPHEHGAWWTFGSCLTAGFILTLAHSGDLMMGLFLVLPMAAIFLISDWVSALSGAFLDERIHADLKAWQPWVFGLLGLAGVAGFAAFLPADERTLWASALVVQSALLALMFLLRQELPSRDIRLLLLSSLLLTSPALFLAAVSSGWDSATVWEFWAWPALYYPAGVLYVKSWMSGRMNHGLRLSTAALPYLALAVLAGLTARWAAVALFAGIATRAVFNIRTRLSEDGARIPAIARIRRFGWEQVAVSLLFMAVWMSSFLRH